MTKFVSTSDGKMRFASKKASVTPVVKGKVSKLSIPPGMKGKKNCK